MSKIVFILGFGAKDRFESFDGDNGKFGKAIEPIKKELRNVNF